MRSTKERPVREENGYKTLHTKFTMELQTSIINKLIKTSSRQDKKPHTQTNSHWVIKIDEQCCACREMKKQKIFNLQKCNVEFS